MASHRYLTCLFLLTASLTDRAKAACNDYFKKSAWKDNLTGELNDTYNIQMDCEPESIMKCSVKNTILQSCFKKNSSATCEGKSPSETRVPFYHLMCLADIARTDREKSKPSPEDVCKVYEKVCRPFVKPSTPAPPATTTSVPSTTPTTVETTPTKITSVSPSSPLMPTSTSSASTTVQPTTAMAVPSTAPTITSTTPIQTTTVSPSSPAMPTTKTPTTESVTRQAASQTAPTTVTEQWSAQTASARNDKSTGDPNETVTFKLLIPFLIFTNIVSPLAVYMYMRHQMNKEIFKKVNQNMLDEGQTTANQQNVVIRIEANEEDAILLESFQGSSIINPPETMQTESPRQHGVEH